MDQEKADRSQTNLALNKFFLYFSFPDKFRNSCGKQRDQKAIKFYRMRCFSNHSPEFLSYGLLSDYILNRQLIMQSLRAAQSHLNCEESGETLILIPPTPEEQKSIVHHIKTRYNRIDAQITRTKKLINLLSEYRAALISEAVTGKTKATD